MDSSFVVRIVRGQAVAVVAGPLESGDAYAALVAARNATDDGSQVVLLPSAIMSDIFTRSGELV